MLEIKDCEINCHDDGDFDDYFEIVVEIASFGIEVGNGQYPDAFLYYE